MVIVICIIFLAVYESGLMVVKICKTLTLTLRSDINKSIESFLLMANVMFAIFVTIYEIFVVEICMTLNLIFRMERYDM